jgi:lipopolysaccharide transport system ATP-binding protein
VTQSSAADRAVPADPVSMADPGFTGEPASTAGPASTAEPAVRVRGLGKRYDIGAAPDGGLYDRLGRLVGSRTRSVDPHPEVWALREVGFEVPQGHVLGVLGRNGSGKSTLMKILARVTSPTEGWAETRGRVGALLQVGTGFHPELSGRDNIGLSGAILGMSREEIASVESEIIEFAEIGRFLDTPVKHYSSGMYLRLAFSVSAHMAAEIMLIDEVLAVGDAAFQQKCQQRIRRLVQEGRTVLFVSHNMGSVRTLSDSAMVLDQGRLVFNGSTEDAATYYQEEILKQ